MEELKRLVDTLSVNMRDNTEAVTNLRVDQAKDRKDHDALVLETRKTRRAYRVAAGVLVVAVGLYLWSDHRHNAHEKKLRDQQSADLLCIAVHEEAQDARSTVLAAKSTARNLALRAMVDAQFAALTYARSKAPSQARLERLVDAWNRRTEAFRRADEAYTRAVADNPVQQLQFTCTDRLAPRRTTTVTPAPSTTTTTATVTHAATATSTATIAVPMPAVTSTVVIRVPAGGGTVTRTVTTTKAPADCVAHPMPPCTLRLPTLPRLP